MMSEEGFQAGYLLMKALQPQFTIRFVWLMSHPVCAEVNNAMQQLTRDMVMESKKETYYPTRTISSDSLGY